MHIIAYLNNILVNCPEYSGLMLSGTCFVSPRMELSMNPGSVSKDESKK